MNTYMYYGADVEKLAQVGRSLHSRSEISIIAGDKNTRALEN